MMHTAVKPVAPQLYRLTYTGTDQGYFRAAEAVRAMARAIKALPMSDTERHAWRSWYVANYRAMVRLLLEGEPLVIKPRSNKGNELCFRIVSTAARIPSQQRRYFQYHCDRCYALIDISALRRKPCILEDLFGNTEVVTELVCKDEMACGARRTTALRDH